MGCEAAAQWPRKLHWSDRINREPYNSFVPKAPELVAMVEQDRRDAACQVALSLVGRHQNPLPAIARRAMNMDTRP